MLLNWVKNLATGPRLLPSGRRLGPNFWSRAEASDGVRPLWASVASRSTASAWDRACQAAPSLTVFVVTVVLVRRRGEGRTTRVFGASATWSPSPGKDNPWLRSPRTSSRLREAPQSKHVDRVPGLAIAGQIREDLADDRRKLEAVPRARAGDHDVRMAGVPIDDEVSIRRVRVHARRGRQEIPVHGREVTLEDSPGLADLVSVDHAADVGRRARHASVVA